MLKTFSFALRIFVLYTLLCVACFLMLRTIIGYTSFRDDAQFLVLKQTYIHNEIWKTAFYIHVFSAIIALLGGFTQFSPEILRGSPKIHRLIGKIYVGNILFINFPIGIVMGIYANGGIPGKTAFIVLDFLWFYFTLKAFLCIKNRQIVAHKNYMIRSYALTFSAVMLRTWKLILSNLLVIDLTELYVIDAWLAILPNLMVAEIIIRWNNRRASSSTAQM